METQNDAEANSSKSTPIIAQIRNWRMPAKEVPMILPIMSWNGRTDEMMISTIRLVFSSMTLRMTMLP